MKIGIIGMGWVGSSVAISTLQGGIARELLVHDVKHEIAEGEAMDLAHGSSFYPRTDVRVAAVEDMVGADAVVVSAGVGGGPDSSRLELLAANAAIARDLGGKLRDFRGLVVVVTNPVDVMTQLITETSGLPPARVLGTGTKLDTSRLRQILGQRLALDPRSVHAQVVGEHGDSEVCLWSSAHVGGTPLRALASWRRADESGVAAAVRGAAYEIIRRKGATNHAIGLVTAALLRRCLRDERQIVTVSRVQEGACGLRDVALSLPAVVGSRGAELVLVPPLDADEDAALQRSAEVLRRARASVDAAPASAA
jgi:L-lactate dehydrogenase